MLAMRDAGILRCWPRLVCPPWGVAIVFSLLCAGCASTTRADATSQPTTAPASVVKLSDAIDLDKLAGDAEPDLSHQVHLSRGGRVYFGTLSTYDNDDNAVTSIPIIARKNGEQWSAIRIDDPRLKNASWAYVGAGPNRGEVWGVLDASLDDDQPDLVFAHSTDGGATFALSSLQKPNASADFDSFCIGPDHKGRVTVYLSGDAGPGEKTFRPGFYHFRTNDGGKTWSSPQYEPDAMLPARDVPDEDQPSTPESPPRKADWKSPAHQPPQAVSSKSPA